MFKASAPFSMPSFADSKSTVQPSIAITGSSGCIGRALTDLLEEKYNAKVIKITRGSTASASEESKIYWDPDNMFIDENSVKLLEGVDAVIHLAGENVASGDFSSPLGPLGRWSAEKKRKIMDSRVKGTKLIVDTVKTLKRKPKLMISASAVGIYGFNDKDTIFTDGANGRRGAGFLADVVEAWEEEALKAQSQAGIRTVCMRLAPVFSKKAGILGKLLPIFSLGGGGIIGNGNQGFSWVTDKDVLRAIEFLLFDKKSRALKGPVNVCSPNPLTNAEFTEAMGEALGRPVILPLPEFAVKLLFGEMGQEMLLGGQKVVPSKLSNAGFVYNDDEIVQAIQNYN